MQFKDRLSMQSATVVLAFSFGASAQTSQNLPRDAASVSLDKVIDKAIEQERSLAKKMVSLRPLIETYMQRMNPHPDLGAVPKSDKYFLGKLDLSHGMHQNSLMSESGWFSTLGQRVKQVYSITLDP